MGPVLRGRIMTGADQGRPLVEAIDELIGGDWVRLWQRPLLAGWPSAEKYVFRLFVQPHSLNLNTGVYGVREECLDIGPTDRLFDDLKSGRLTVLAIDEDKYIKAKIPHHFWGTAEWEIYRGPPATIRGRGGERWFYEPRLVDVTPTDIDQDMLEAVATLEKAAKKAGGKIKLRDAPGVLKNTLSWEQKLAAYEILSPTFKNTPKRRKTK
jgi:hypothetical protein